MRRIKLMKRTLLSTVAILAGGTVLSNGCMNAVASLPICGGILTYCTPADQLALFYPVLEIPDYQADPSCTIPLSCGGSDLFTGTGFVSPFGGSESEEPEDDQGGGLGTGGGAGGGGI